MSRTYTGRPSRVSMTMSPIAEVASNSPGTRTRYFSSPTSMEPPGTVTFSPRTASLTSLNARP